MMAVAIIGVLALIVIAGLLVANNMTADDNKDEILNETVKAITSSCGDNEPYIDLSVKDRLAGSTVTVGVDATVNDDRKGIITTGSSGRKFKVGDKLDLLLNATNYIDKVVSVEITECGLNDVADLLGESVTIDASTAAGVSFDLWEKSTDLGDSVDGSSGNNATAIAAGGSANYILYVEGTDNKASGDLVYVIELGSSQNVSSITMTDAADVKLEDADVPNFYTDTITSPYKDAFLLPSFDNAVEKEFKINVALNTGKTISGAVYTTAYAKQAFVDNDNSYVVGISDTDNNAATEYAWTDDVDMYITAA